ncbi:DUF6314 family protein [Nocardioides pyridinolyticus]
MREIDDRLAGERRDVRGSATLALEAPGRVRWSEEGTMTWGDRSVPVSRTLYAVLVDDAWWVEFSDGRPFHPWGVDERVTHPCAPDTYVGLIEVGGRRDGEPVERWTVEWRATGPEKDYVMRTVHSGRR